MLIQQLLHFWLIFHDERLEEFQVCEGHHADFCVQKNLEVFEIPVSLSVGIDSFQNYGVHYIHSRLVSEIAFFYLEFFLRQDSLQLLVKAWLAKVLQARSVFTLNALQEGLEQ